MVQRVRAVADGEPDRLAVLSGLETVWRPFLSAWLTSASFLAKCGTGSLPEEVYRRNTLDQNLAWAWEEVDPYIDATLHTVDVRCSLSSAVTYQAFEVLRGAALILPDGSVLPIMRERSKQHAQADASTLVAKSVTNAWKVSRAIAATERDKQDRKDKDAT